MNRTALVPVFTGTIQNQPIQLCNARDLHVVLESSQQFSDWIKDRIEKYGFTDGEDFFVNLRKTSKGTKGGRPATEYHLTLDMAKELAMVENNDKGRQVRRYFIALERTAQPAPKALPKKSEGIPPERQSAINRRAWELAQGTYENFRERMAWDVMVSGGHTAPDKWEPVECTTNVMESIEAIAHAMEATVYAMRQRGRTLAGLVGKDYDREVERFLSPDEKSTRFK